MEKFGLLNLLKALETLTPKNNAAATGQTDGQPPATTQAPPVQQTQPAEAQKQTDLEHNVMFKVLFRHEQAANRIKNNRR